MASINDLDNPLLVLILNKLCIQKLFTAGHVCVRWNAMRDMSVSERKELILMVGNDAKRYIDDSELRVPNRQLLVDENGDLIFPEDDQNVQLQIHSFPLDFARLLLTLFTNLTTLTISCRVNENLDSIIHLLEQFNRSNGTLRTLKLYSTQEDRNTELNDNQIRAYQRLLAAVNSIGSLRKLSFDVNAKFVENSNYPEIDLPILANLEELEFNSADVLDCFHNSISNYALNNPRLRKIGFNNFTINFTWLLALPTEFASRFTHLHFQLIDDTSVPFQNLCRHFDQLTSLRITFMRNLGETYFTFFKLFRPLTHLSNLLSLKVYTNVCTILCSSVNPNQRGIMHFELPSVKVLTINISDNNILKHDFFHACNMNRIFPNVQVVRVIRNGAICGNCKVNMDATADQVEVGEHCTRYMFRHFTHSQHLKMVCAKIVGDDVVGPRYRQWAWNEMEPFEDEDEEIDTDRIYLID